MQEGAAAHFQYNRVRQKVNLTTPTNDQNLK